MPKFTADSFGRLFLNTMGVRETGIQGLLVVEPRVFQDARGYFFEAFKKDEFEAHIGKTDFIQDNESKSSYGVLRGLHYQKGDYSQAKLVRVIKGCVIDVAVDIRKSSPTFGQHVMVELSDENKRQFFIPKGFAHGFSVLSETAIFNYKCDNLYHPEADGGILLNDPDLAIDWQIPEDLRIISEKDTRHPLLKDLDNPF